MDSNQTHAQIDTLKYQLAKAEACITEMRQTEDALKSKLQERNACIAVLEDSLEKRQHQCNTLLHMSSRS